MSFAGRAMGEMARAQGCWSMESCGFSEMRCDANQQRLRPWLSNKSSLSMQEVPLSADMPVSVRPTRSVSDGMVRIQLGGST